MEERRPLTDARRRARRRRSRSACSRPASRSAWSRSSSRRSRRAGSATSPRSRPTRPSRRGPKHLANVSSSSRWLWWKEAWRAWNAQPWHGTGAGSFDLVHRLLRTNSIVVTEPHNVPLQFLARPASSASSSRSRRSGRRRSGVWRRVRGRDPAMVALAVLAVALRAPLAGRLRLGLRRRERAVPALGRRAARRARRARRAADRVGAAAGRRGGRGRVLAADAVVRGALDRLRLGPRWRTAGRSLPTATPRDARSLNPLAIDPLIVAGPGAAAARRLAGRAAALHRRGRPAAAELAPLAGARHVRGRPAGLRPRAPGARARGRARPVQLVRDGRARESLGRTRPEPDLRPEGREQPVDERLGEVRGRPADRVREEPLAVVVEAADVGEARVAQRRLSRRGL